MRGERFGIGEAGGVGGISPRMVAPIVRQKSATICLRASVGLEFGGNSSITVPPIMDRFRAEFPFRRVVTGEPPADTQFR